MRLFSFYVHNVLVLELIITLGIHAPRGYGSRSVCTCMSVTALATTYLVCMSIVRHRGRLLKILSIVWTLLHEYSLLGGCGFIFAHFNDR